MTVVLTTLNPEKREVIDVAHAKLLTETWKKQLEEEKESGSSILCEKIVLEGKSYTPEGASIISSFLKSTDHFQPSIASGIREAILSDVIASQPESKGLEVLTTFSKTFQDSKLEEVDLSDNAMGTKGVDACETILSGPTVSSTLQRLKLCNNGLSESTMDEVASLLTQVDPDDDSSCIAKNLTQIHFFNNMSGDDGCVSFKRILGMLEKPEDIRFSGTRAKAKGSREIAFGLKDLARRGKLGGIKRLDLADNSFGDCYQDLAEALRACTQLEYLDLHDCCLGDDGVVAVCEALLVAKSPLSFLSLGGNDIEKSHGAKSIAKLIESINKSIISFDASENELKSPGIRSIARAFRSDTVQKIHLNQNECGTVGANELIEMAGRLPNLVEIQLDSNYFLPDVVAKLEAAFSGKLVEMEENIDDEDADDELDDEDLKDDPHVDTEKDTENSDPTVDDLADTLEKSAKI